MLDDEVAELGFAALFDSGWVWYEVICWFIRYLKRESANGKLTQVELVLTE